MLLKLQKNWKTVITDWLNGIMIGYVAGEDEKVLGILMRINIIFLSRSSFVIWPVCYDLANINFKAYSRGKLVDCFV